MCIDKEPNNNVRGKKSPSSPSTSKEQSKNKRDGEKKKETAKIPSNSAKKETAKIPSNSVGKEDIGKVSGLSVENSGADNYRHYRLTKLDKNCVKILLLTIHRNVNIKICEM
jgi:hypothetical protein